MLGTILALILWALPFVVAAWLVHAGAPAWLAFLICFVLLVFVVWGFAAPSAGEDT